MIPRAMIITPVLQAVDVAEVDLVFGSILILFGVNLVLKN